MNMHWGAGLAVAFLVFAAVILTMVAISMNREVDLVADDYYRQELRHQDEIEKETRTNALTVQPSILVSPSSVSLTIPVEFPRNATTGSVTFYRPSNRKLDFMLPLQLDSLNAQTIRTAGLEPGLWRVTLRWKYHETEYTHEEPVMIR